MMPPAVWLLTVNTFVISKSSCFPLLAPVRDAAPQGFQRNCKSSISDDVNSKDAQNVCCFKSRRMDLERGERPPPRGRQMASSRHLLWSWLLLRRLGAPDLSPRVCLCKEFHHQGHEAEENGAPKKPLSHLGLKDVAQRRRSRTWQEAE